MSEEKNVIEEIVAAIKKLLGFGDEEQITTAVNGVVEATDEAGVVSALKGLFGDAISDADLTSVVQNFTGEGGSIDLTNIMDLFNGIGDKVGGFDKIAGLVGMAANAGAAGKITDTVKSVTGAVSGAAEGAADAAAGAAGSVTGAVAGAASSVTGAVSEAAGSVTGAVSEAAGSVTGAVAGAAGAATGAAANAAGSVTGAVKGAAGKAAGAVDGAVEGVKQVAAEPAAKAKKKWPIVLGVVAAVLLLAGIGMFIWHEQPSFCGAICHAPMDAYLEGYNQEDNAAGVDKYGNDVSNTHSMLAVSHKSQGVACLDCHVPSIAQQIGEGTMMISGSYTVVERANGNGFAQHERNLSELLVNAGHPDDTGKGDQFCLRSGCHEMERSDLVTAVTVEGSMRQPHMWLNTPHASAGGMEFACSDCHKSHRASVNACTACHADAVSPEGWLTFKDGNAALKAAA